MANKLTYETVCNYIDIINKEVHTTFLIRFLCKKGTNNIYSLEDNEHYYYQGTLRDVHIYLNGCYDMLVKNKRKQGVVPKQKLDTVPKQKLDASKEMKFEVSRLDFYNCTSKIFYTVKKQDNRSVYVEVVGSISAKKEPVLKIVLSDIVYVDYTKNPVGVSYMRKEIVERVEKELKRRMFEIANEIGRNFETYKLWDVEYSKAEDVLNNYTDLKNQMHDLKEYLTCVSNIEEDAKELRPLRYFDRANYEHPGYTIRGIRQIEN